MLFCHYIVSYMSHYFIVQLSRLLESSLAIALGTQRAFDFRQGRLGGNATVLKRGSDTECAFMRGVAAMNTAGGVGAVSDKLWLSTGTCTQSLSYISTSPSSGAYRTADMDASADINTDANGNLVDDLGNSASGSLQSPNAPISPASLQSELSTVTGASDRASVTASEDVSTANLESFLQDSPEQSPQPLSAQWKDSRSLQSTDGSIDGATRAEGGVIHTSGLSAPHGNDGDSGDHGDKDSNNNRDGDKAGKSDNDGFQQDLAQRQKINAQNGIPTAAVEQPRRANGNSANAAANSDASAASQGVNESNSTKLVRSRAGIELLPLSTDAANGEQNDREQQQQTHSNRDQDRWRVEDDGSYSLLLQQGEYLACVLAESANLRIATCQAPLPGYLSKTPGSAASTESASSALSLNLSAVNESSLTCADKASVRLAGAHADEGTIQTATTHSTTAASGTAADASSVSIKEWTIHLDMCLSSLPPEGETWALVSTYMMPVAPETNSSTDVDSVRDNSSNPGLHSSSGPASARSARKSGAAYAESPSADAQPAVDPAGDQPSVQQTGTLLITPTATTSTATPTASACGPPSRIVGAIITVNSDGGIGALGVHHLPDSVLETRPAVPVGESCRVTVTCGALGGVRTVNTYIDGLLCASVPLPSHLNTLASAVAADAGSAATAVPVLTSVTETVPTADNLSLDFVSAGDRNVAPASTSAAALDNVAAAVVADASPSVSTSSLATSNTGAEPKTISTTAPSLLDLALITTTPTTSKPNLVTTGSTNNISSPVGPNANMSTSKAVTTPFDPFTLLSSGIFIGAAPQLLNQCPGPALELRMVSVIFAELGAAAAATASANPESSYLSTASGAATVGLGGSLRRRQSANISDTTAERLSLAGVTTEGSVVPVWRDGIFAGMFGDAYIENTSFEGGLISPSLLVLGHVLDRVLKSQRWWLDDCISTDNLTAVAAVRAMFSAALPLSKQVDLCTSASSILYPFLHRLRHSIITMPIGGTLILPGGWRTATSGHALIYIVERETALTYRFVLLNTGDGLEYHPASAHQPPKIKVRTAIALANIPVARMADEAWWLAVYLLFVKPTPSNGADRLYQKYLPLLAGKPLAAAIAETYYDKALTWRTPQRAGTCYFRCVLELLRYSLLKAGLTEQQAKRVKFACKYELMLMARNDLACARAVASSDKRLMLIACRQLAYTAGKGAAAGVFAVRHLHRVLTLIEAV